MMQSVKFGVFIDTLKSKFIYIILLAIIFSLGLVIEKTFFTDYVIQSTRFYTEKTIKIEYNQPLMFNNSLDYGTFLKSYSEIDLFLKQSENRFDYKKINSDWDKLTEIQKVEWLQKHIHVVDIHSGVIQFIFTLSADDAKDYEYIKLYGTKYLDEYISFAESRINQITPQSQFKEVSTYTLEPKLLANDKNIIIIKYGIIGAVLGTIIGVVIVFLISIRNEKNG
ncbi:hypothetical protein [Veillonella sp. LMAG:90]|uniref:hypothetical protein n=1 Tax=Veillonella sp. LMAG:90 TaxID=1969174 RepID=UPI0025FC41F4|nr:hypothetical protein [Veillonella sp. LMAG:90]